MENPAFRGINGQFDRARFEQSIRNNGYNEARFIAELREQEELDAIRPDLTGEEIMQVLGIGPGPDVGKAYRYLLEVRLDRGPIDPDQAFQSCPIRCSD